MFKVAVIDSERKVLEPCHPAVARRLLRDGAAAVWCKYPFTIILKRVIPEDEIVTGVYSLNWDPGSRTSGIAILDNANNIVMKAELHHRGFQIKKALKKRAGFRRGRRTRNLRHRRARWANRGRKSPVLTETEGWRYKRAEDESDLSKDSSKTKNKFVRVSSAQLKDKRYRYTRIKSRTCKKFTPEMTNAEVARLTRDKLIHHIMLRDKKAERDALLSKRLGFLRSALKAKLKNKPPTKYRWKRERIGHKKRADNGWIAPSLMSRVFNLETWTRRLMNLYPIKRLAIEEVKFDMQLLENLDIHGIEYQRGPLYRREKREYLLELTKRKCAYCGKGGQRLEREHIYPQALGGSDRLDNLTMACHACNQKKGRLWGKELEKRHPEIAKKIKTVLSKSKRGFSLSDAAAVNTIRWKLVETLQATQLPVFCGSGGRTAYNRNSAGLPKTHYYDAAAVENTPQEACAKAPVLVIRALGYGSRNNLKYRFGCTKGGKFPGFRQKIFNVSHINGFHRGDHVYLTKENGRVEGVINCFEKTPPRKPQKCRVDNFYKDAKDKRESGNLSELRRFRHRDGYGYGYRKDTGSSPKPMQKPETHTAPKTETEQVRQPNPKQIEAQQLEFPFFT